MTMPRGGTPADDLGERDRELRAQRPRRGLAALERAQRVPQRFFALDGEPGGERVERRFGGAQRSPLVDLLVFRSSAEQLVRAPEVALPRRAQGVRREQRAVRTPCARRGRATSG